MHPSGGLNLSIERRKEDHIEICLTKDVVASRNWWDDVVLDHAAIPVCDLEEVELGVTFLDHHLSAPLIISAMTGGSRKAQRYNGMLARAAEEFGIGMGVGSQRAGIEKEERRSSYTVVKDHDVPLVLANIGAPQLTEKMAPGIGGRLERSKDAIAKAVEMIDADAVCVHLNYLQEIVQAEGENVVGGLNESIKELSMEFRLIAKETGAGISGPAALHMKELGFCALDVGGMSGTTFSAVESYRGKDALGRTMRMGRTFWNWGIPTPVSLLESRVGLPLIATGGLRDGLDLGRALSLGADCGGMARTLLVAASKGYPMLREEISCILEELRAVVFLSGCRKVQELSATRTCLIGRSLEVLEQRRHGIISGPAIKMTKHI